MSLFDRYIIKQYFATFFFTCFIFTLISVVIDFSDKVEKFMDSGVSTGKVISEYYVNFVPWINGILWPLFALMAVIFFTSRLAKNSEIIAVLGAGMSFGRFLRPYLIASGLLAIIHFAGNHYFIPQGNKTFIGFNNTYMNPSSKKTRAENIHIFLDPSSKIFVRNFRSRDTSMRGVFLERFENNKLTELVKAERMEWLGPPNQWRLTDYSIRTFSETDQSLQIESKQSLDTALALLPRDFIRYSNEKDMMNSFELQELVNYDRSKGLGTAKTVVTEIHRRSADPFTLIILTIMGVAVASRKVRGGVGLHLALGITIGALYIILSRFAITFSNQLDLPAGISVWIPNIFFGAVAALLVFRAQK